MTKQHLFGACAASALALGALAMAGSALAQATSPPPPRPAAPSVGGTTIGEIVVTAERREANLQDVPEAVTAFTAQDRNIKGIETVQDMTNFVPGLTYSSQLDRPAMRGLARSTNIYLADSSVAIYYDDFFSNSTFLVGRDDMLVDQVEVLVGPQGTLYGRNAIGGLINTISKKPTDELSGEFRAIVGNYGYTKFEYTVSGPIMPHLDFRISMYDENQTQGWLQNVVPGQPTEGGIRHDPYGDIQIQYKNDHDEIWFDSYVVGFNGDRGGPGALLGTPTAGPYGTNLTTYGELNFNPNAPYGSQNYSTGAGVPGIVPGSVVGMIGSDNPVVTTGDLRDFAHNTATNITVDKAYTFTLHWTHHFDGFDVKYVGGYSQYHYELHDPYFNNDDSPISSYQLQPGAACGVVGPAVGIPASAACSPLTVNPTQIFSFTTQTDWFSHEITLSSTWNKPLQWVAGLYYFNETDNNPETDYLPGQPQVASPLNVNTLSPALPNPSQDEFLLDYQDRIQSAAAYAQVDYKITPHLKLTGGFRYTLDWKHGTEESRYVYFGAGDLYAGTPYAGLFTWQTLGGALPAFDITTAEIDLPSAANPGTGKGICGLPVLQTSGAFEGDYTRCLSDHSSAPTGTAGVEWTPNDDTLVYARYNRGYKAFAFNAGYISSNTEAAPEHVDDFEVGYKGTFGHNFTLDADAFYYNYQNDQVPIGVPAGEVTLTEFINIPKAVSDGVEIEAYWRPVRHLDLSLTYGFDHTAILTGCTVVGGVPTGACYVDALDPYGAAPGARPVATVGGVAVQAVKGDELPQAPENKVSLNAIYTFEFDPGNLSLSATYVWKDKSYSEIFSRSYYEAPSWDQVDLRATWSGHHDRYEIILFVRNLFNTLGYDAAADGYIAQNPVGNLSAGITQVPAFDLTPPRTFGAEFHYKF
jgi:iron complex outermembrane receptor protein